MIDDRRAERGTNGPITLCTMFGLGLGLGLDDPNEETGGAEPEPAPGELFIFGGSPGINGLGWFVLGAPEGF